MLNTLLLVLYSLPPQTLWGYFNVILVAGIFLLLGPHPRQ